MKHTEYIIPIGGEAKEYDEMFIGVIRRQPALVRCKDCKWCQTFYHGDTQFSYRCAKLYLTETIDDNDFCSRAERRQNKHEL